MRLSDLPITNPVNTNSPKYLQIAAVLEEYLQRADLAEGERFFSDRMLAKRFSTTSVTVAHSLNYLVNKGLLCRRRGSGTYVGKRLPACNSRTDLAVIPKDSDMTNVLYIGGNVESRNYKSISAWNYLVVGFDYSKGADAP